MSDFLVFLFAKFLKTVSKSTCLAMLDLMFNLATSTSRVCDTADRKNIFTSVAILPLVRQKSLKWSHDKSATIHKRQGLRLEIEVSVRFGLQFTHCRQELVTKSLSALKRRQHSFIKLSCYRRHG